MRLDGMVSGMHLTTWAATNAERFLSPLGNRWLHVQQVAEQARQISKVVPSEDRDLLVASAYLHDVGYSSLLAETGFHPLDGGRWVRDHGPGGRLARLVAHHSCAVHEARVRGLEDVLLNEFEPEHSTTYDALVYCDMTTGPTGKVVTLDERLAEVLDRYEPGHDVTKALELSSPSLTACCERTLARIKNDAA